jgi:hypothetical protein
MTGNPQKYESRINHYMDNLGLSAQTKIELKARLLQYKSINAEQVKDIFICNEQDDMAERLSGNIWFFSNNVAGELKGLGPDWKVSLMNHGNIVSARMEASYFDLLVAGKESSIDLTVLYSFGQKYLLSARGYNCSNLLNLFRKYFSKGWRPANMPG